MKLRRVTDSHRNPYEWWSNRPRWLKFLAAAAVFAVTAWLWYEGWAWPWGFGIGLALVIDAWFFAD